MAQKKTITEIRELLQAEELQAQLFAELQADPRKGVQQLLIARERRMQRQQEEQERLYVMGQYERLWRQKGIERICGVDEAGRGPLAGPVAVAAVILPPDCLITGINDSKKLSPLQRDRLYEEVQRQALAVSLIWVEPEEIDQYNIYQATVRGMERAVLQLQPAPQAILADAVDLKRLAIPCQALIHGDALSASIAAASIVAKVERDRLMVKLDEQYPGYSLREHKGYGTAEHMAALQKLGPSPIHRKTFEPIRSMLAGRDAR
nr:ribonuclease HII [uncultured Anaeromusa sp.]